MVRVKPFRGIRPREDRAARVSALPYDVMNRKEAAAMAADNKDSILHITRAEIDFPDEVGDYDEAVYAKAKENLSSFLHKKILNQEEKPVYYIYREIMGENCQTGIVAVVAVEDYENGSVMKHELTRKEKEKDRIRHFEICDCHTEPVFLTYRHQSNIDGLITDWVNNNRPVYDFTAEDSVIHQLWVIDNEAVIANIETLFAATDKLYIADGHHRTASAAAVGKIKKKKVLLKQGDDPANYFMAVIFPDKDLSIMAYNRVVKFPENLDIQVFFENIAAHFSVTKMTDEFTPGNKHEFGLYIQNTWYRLTAKAETYQNTDLAENLDAAILQKYVLAPLLGIGDPRTDPHIDFIGGIRGNKEIIRRCNEEHMIGFNLYPVEIADLMNIADENKIMPPKSTWFEPKLRSGLFLHSLKEK